MGISKRWSKDGAMGLKNQWEYSKINCSAGTICAAGEKECQDLGNHAEAADKVDFH